MKNPNAYGINLKEDMVSGWMGAGWGTPLPPSQKGPGTSGNIMGSRWDTPTPQPREKTWAQ